jgi:hypothetical protein
MLYGYTPEKLDPAAEKILKVLDRGFTPLPKVIEVAGVTDEAAALAIPQLQRLGYINVIDLPVGRLVTLR